MPSRCWVHRCLMCASILSKQNHPWVWANLSTHQTFRPILTTIRFPNFEWRCLNGPLWLCQLVNHRNNPTSFPFRFPLWNPCPYSIFWSRRVVLYHSGLGWLNSYKLCDFVPFLSLWDRGRVGRMLLPGGDYLNHNSLTRCGSMSREWGTAPGRV